MQTLLRHGGDRRGHRARLGPALAVAMVAVILGRPGVASDFDVVISEIHYHPPEAVSGQQVGEFIELANPSDAPVDVSGWSLQGGVLFLFPDGARIPAGGFVVVAQSAANIEAAYGITGAYGDIVGSLSNGGEKVELRNAKGNLIDRIDYRDDSPWPENPDGLGPSLEKKDLTASGEDQGSWQASIFLGGTPGARNSTDRNRTVTTIVAPGDTWRYRKGRSEPSSQWTRIAYNDAAWPQGPSGFGYGDGDDATLLDDMENNYVTVYIRKKFTLASPADVGSLQLSIIYDDAYVAYLNGVEIGRSPSAGGTPGTPRPFDARAAGEHENDDGAGSIELTSFPTLLNAGTNVLAIQGLNVHSGSSDFSLIPTLTTISEESTGIVEPAHDLEINEVFEGAGATEGFIEIYNEGGESADLSGYKLVASPVGDGGYALPPGTTLAPGAFLAVSVTDLPFPLTADSQWFGLVTPDRRFVDGVSTRSREAGTSWGRYPDGDGDTFVLEAPTPSGPNTLERSGDIVINEVQYHPPLAVSTAEYVELFNRSGLDLDISGWRLDKAVKFTFLPGTVLPAGSYLVVARDPAAVEDRYAISSVAGPWSGKLANNTEKIELKSAAGNVVDVVHYADDGRWPLTEGTTGPDGGGPSIELVNPFMENNHGSAWLASSGNGTPGKRNSAYSADPACVIRSVAHTPPTPRSDDAVTVTARVSDEDAVVSVKLFLRVDGGGSFSQTEMLDDGLHGDGMAEDGRYGASLPARASGTIVQFYVEAEDSGANVRRYPAGAPGRVCLYQVDDASYPAALPLYRAILRDADLQELENRDVQSDVLLDGTFIHGKHVTYNVGIRYRGEHSRYFPVKSFRIQLTDDESFEGITDLNLNAEGVEPTHLSADFFRRADMPAFQTRPVAYTLNKSWQAKHGGIYVRVENVDHFFLERQFPGDSGGNLYRGMDPSGDAEGDLSYRGSNPDDYVTSYHKRTNQEENDYSDIIELTRTFTRTPDGDFPAAIDALIDVPQWMRYLAVETVLNNRDGCISRNSGEDYFIYRRPSDSKWVLMPWDQNETFTRPEYGIYRQDIQAIKRLVMNPAFLPLYHENLLELLDGPFQTDVMSRRVDAARYAFSAGSLDSIAAFVPVRQETIRSLLPVIEDRSFVRGDGNEDGEVDISDALVVLLYLFGGRQVSCLDALDTDDSGEIDVTDAIYLLGFLFQSGSEPPSPFPSRGSDPTTGDSLSCPP